MHKKKIEIVPPICAALPTLKVFKNDEQARFRSHVDLAREAFCSAPNSDRFKMPLIRSAQMPSGSYFISSDMVASCLVGLIQNTGTRLRAKVSTAQSV